MLPVDSQKPAIGRVVHFRLPDRTTVLSGERIRPAEILAVHSASCVDLMVTMHHDEDVHVGTHRPFTSVCYGDGPYQWQWPPRV